MMLKQSAELFYMSNEVTRLARLTNDFNLSLFFFWGGGPAKGLKTEPLELLKQDFFSRLHTLPVTQTASS